MISLMLPPKDQIARAAKMLAEEYGTASNIKSNVNRKSVLTAITSVQAKLKLYPKGGHLFSQKYYILVPTNGLVIYSGTVATEEGKEKKVRVNTSFIALVEHRFRALQTDWSASLSLRQQISHRSPPRAALR